MINQEQGAALVDDGAMLGGCPRSCSLSPSLSPVTSLAIENLVEMPWHGNLRGDVQNHTEIC